MANRAKTKDATRFGIGEWFGHLLGAMSASERAEHVRLAQAKVGTVPCPFRSGPSGAVCNKRGGVCSLRLYQLGADGVVSTASGPSGALRSVCPHRFEEGDLVRAWIGAELLGTDQPLHVPEVPFLKPERSRLGDEDDRGSVGRIDSVLVHPGQAALAWCAVEVQAVYFSGPALSRDFSLLEDLTHDGTPFPTAIRRPDYRSSGPKRLMPQLQIKVPTLRRWGKKMAVVVDEAFFESLGSMDTVADTSNADIVWFVVGFEEQGRTARLVPRFTRATTLERAVEGLTAGVPVTLGQFEQEIRRRIPRGAGSGLLGASQETG